MTTVRKLDRLLHPRSIAIIGGAPAAEAARQCERMGFAGDIWPVHPEKSEIAGRRAYQVRNPSLPPVVVLQADKKTWLAGHGGLIGQMLQPAEGPVRRLLDQAPRGPLDVTAVCEVVLPRSVANPITLSLRMAAVRSGTRL